MAELAYAERTTSLVNQTNTAYADTGLIVPDFTVGATPVYLEFQIEELQYSTSAIPVFALCKSDNTVVKETTGYTGINFAKAQVRFVKRFAPSFGAVSGYKIRHKVNSGESITLNATLVGELAAWVLAYSL